MINIFKTTLLLTSLTLLFLGLGHMMGGVRGMYFAFIFTFVMNFGAYWFSDQLVLRMYRAQSITEQDAPEIFQMLQELSARAGIPMPKVFVIPSASPNAFATGRSPNHASVAVTQGIVELLNYEELKGVLAHELGHVIHRDTLISCVAATLAGAISYAATLLRWAFMFTGGRGARQESNPLALLGMSILMPVAAALIQLAISRSREYAADRRGAELCGNPLFLAAALEKISEGMKRLPMRDSNVAVAHLFIMNPLRNKGFAALFCTHPPVEERLARLDAMAREQGI